MENLNGDLKSKIEKILYFTCPYCGKKTLISEAKIVQQKDKTIRKETQFKTGPLGKMYAETTEVYTAFNIRQCPACAKKHKRNIYIIFIICGVIFPIVMGVIKMSFVSFFAAIFLGLIFLMIIAPLLMDKRVDINDAYKKNAIAPPSYLKF